MLVNGEVLMNTDTGQQTSLESDYSGQLQSSDVFRTLIIVYGYAQAL